MQVGDMVRVNKELRDGFGRGLIGKVAIVLETYKRTVPKSLISSEEERGLGLGLG